MPIEANTEQASYQGSCQESSPVGQIATDGLSDAGSRDAALHDATFQDTGLQAEPEPLETQLQTPSAQPAPESAAWTAPVGPEAAQPKDTRDLQPAEPVLTESVLADPVAQDPAGQMSADQPAAGTAQVITAWVNTGHPISQHPGQTDGQPVQQAPARDTDEPLARPVAQEAPLEKQDVSRPADQRAAAEPVRHAVQENASLLEGSLTAPKPGKTNRAPLPERMRPKSMDLFLGQPHLEQRIQALLGAKNLPSLLFFGPPGCGKSTIALLLARATNRPFERVSAPETSVTQLRRLTENVDLLIVDELHRFSKAQQDFFLPLLEDGSLTLLATTTENPSFSITRQLLSRLSVLRLRPLELADLMELARRGARQLNCDLKDDVLGLLCDTSRGDARALLNLVEYVASLPGSKDDVNKVRAVLPDMVNRHDKSGDSHYELASALIKSIRGSDPDAALYYLACLLEGGEDPRFICRRLILSASEDVGLADPNALPMAVACQQAVEFVGMPEGFIPLAETVTYLALARKSNSSYAAYLNARHVLRSQGPLPVPLHLRNASTELQKSWGYGRGYLYPHNYREAWVEQRYLPEGIALERFYMPKGNGEELRLSQWWRRKHNIRPENQ